ncbi:MAG: immunity 51 family protein [Defluviitaleaceae bacterium]|nr:immunity 51 family protein [Defluviitaleaceae bacterium]
MDHRKLFLPRPREVKKLRKQITSGYYKRNPKFNFGIFIMFTLVSAVSIFIGINAFISGERLDQTNLSVSLTFIIIGGGLFLIVSLAMIREYIKRRASHRKMLENLEQCHGGVDKVLDKIGNLLNSSEEHAQMYTVRMGEFHIVGDWYIHHDEYKHIVHISQIAAIIGSRSRGTYLIYEYDDKTATCVEFGGEGVWGDVFELFSEINPDILDSSSLVTLHDGKVVNTKKMYRKKQYAAIIEAYKNLKDFKEKIKPFDWVEHDAGCSFLLNVGTYKNEIFETRADEGFEGGGYDWQSLAHVFLVEKMPELVETVKFDSEGSMFCAYSNSANSLKKFALGFKSACEDDKLIQDIFSRAKLD